MQTGQMKGTPVSSKEIDGTAPGDLVERDKADRVKKSWFGRIVLFVQQVMSELKKVVTPTRKELINYFLVVLAFVVIMMTLVWLFDQLFGWVTVFIFGSPL
jgi:preprotein translocase subunit SecE